MKLAGGARYVNVFLNATPRGSSPPEGPAPLDCPDGPDGPDGPDSPNGPIRPHTAPAYPCTGSAFDATSPFRRPMNSARDMTSCFLPAPRARTATVPEEASRAPITAM